MDINLEYYKIFYYVGKLNSISKAANKLCISQPAVSQSVKLLEKELGADLFIRTSKGTRLTKEGETLFSYVERGYETLLLGEKKFKEMTNLTAGEIHIGASDMTLRYYLLPYLEKFHEEHPEIKISVTNAPSPETLNNLEDGKIDFGVISEPYVARQGFVYNEVATIRDVFVAGRKFIELKNKTLSYKQLEDNPIILLEENTSTRKYMDKFLQDEGVDINPEFQLATSDMIVQFALRNLGIGCVVRDFAEEYMDSGELFELQFGKKIPARHICLVTSDKNAISLAGKTLLKELLDNTNKRK